MFLDILTFLMLMAVVGVKYGTWKHASILHQELRDVERTCEQNNQNYQKICQKREAGERDEKALKRDRYALAAYFERQKKKVEAQKQHNEELEKKLI